MSNYSMSTYWEEKLRKRFDLTGVGCVVLGPAYNARLYKARQEALEKGLKVVGRTFQGARVLEAGCGTGFYTDLSWFWKGYAMFWRYAWRLARWSVVDYLLPPVLAWLDKNWFLPKWGSRAPNNKWLFALKEEKENVA